LDLPPVAPQAPPVALQDLHVAIRVLLVASREEVNFGFPDDGMVERDSNVN